MGSRRGRYAALVSVALFASCTVGAPPGFSSGESWTIPLVGPLEDGLLIVPAMVNHKGPYLFAIDCDAHVSIVDQDLVRQTGARIAEGPHLLDETDTQQPRFIAEIIDWQLGNLTVQGPKYAQIVTAKIFDADGRRISGVIGRDIIADSLVFTFDRDLGVVGLTTQKRFKPAPTAIAVKYAPLYSRIGNVDVAPLPRRLVNASVGGQPVTMHIDFGSSPSQLRARWWTPAKLVESDLQLSLVDEVGVAREVKKQGVADVVELAGARTQNVAFVPYVDKRWLEQDLDGTLGLDFWRPYAVSVSWDDATAYLTPRRSLRETLTARLSRWQSKTLTSCREPGCIKASLIDPLAGKPLEEGAKHPGLVASFTRDAGTQHDALEALVAVSPAAGKEPLKWLVVNLPAGVERTLTHLPVEYLGATLEVVDASPFPRECPAPGGCVDLMAPPK